MMTGCCFEPTTLTLGAGALTIVLSGPVIALLSIKQIKANQRSFHLSKERQFAKVKGTFLTLVIALLVEAASHQLCRQFGVDLVLKRVMTILHRLQPPKYN